MEKGCVRVDWNCLNWNKSAKDFYDKLGAVCLDEWQLYRLTGERLLEFAAKKPKIASSCWWCLRILVGKPKIFRLSLTYHTIARTLTSAPNVVLDKMTRWHKGDATLLGDQCYENCGLKDRSFKNLLVSYLCNEWFELHSVSIPLDCIKTVNKVYFGYRIFKTSQTSVGEFLSRSGAINRDSSIIKQRKKS